MVGFELEPAGAIVALELDIDPIKEGKLTTWVTSGVATAVQWLRWRHPRVGAIEVLGVPRE